MLFSSIHSKVPRPRPRWKKLTSNETIRLSTRSPVPFESNFGVAQDQPQTLARRLRGYQAISHPCARVGELLIDQPCHPKKYPDMIRTRGLRVPNTELFQKTARIQPKIERSHPARRSGERVSGHDPDIEAAGTGCRPQPINQAPTSDGRPMDRSQLLACPKYDVLFGTMPTGRACFHFRNRCGLVRSAHLQPIAGSLFFHDSESPS
jgi:hypothetical protein